MPSTPNNSTSDIKHDSNVFKVYSARVITIEREDKDERVNETVTIRDWRGREKGVGKTEED